MMKMGSNGGFGAPIVVFEYDLPLKYPFPNDTFKLSMIVFLFTCQDLWQEFGFLKRLRVYIKILFRRAPMKARTRPSLVALRFSS